jgi:hypothetical protein
LLSESKIRKAKWIAQDTPCPPPRSTLFTAKWPPHRARSVAVGRASLTYSESWMISIRSGDLARYHGILIKCVNRA